MPRIGGALDIAQVAPPTTPPSGRSKLYFKSDGLLYTKAPDGTERLIDSAPVGTPPDDRATYVQPTQPVVAPGTSYLWVQTGLGPSGADMTFWVEDGVTA